LAKSFKKNIHLDQGASVQSLFGKTFLCLFCSLIVVSCQKKESAEAPSMHMGDSAKQVAGAGDSSAIDAGQAAHALRLRTVNGVVFSTGGDSLAALAIETENRQVIILIGGKTDSLRRRQHQKVSVTGFWRPASAAGARDSLEVADFAFLRE